MADSDALASWIELEGCFNFRDLGSYTNATGRRMRAGQVFRADGLQRLTEPDLDRLCGEIGLGGVIDLRSSDEVAARNLQLLGAGVAGQIDDLATIAKRAGIGAWDNRPVRCSGRRRRRRRPSSSAGICCRRNGLASAGPDRDRRTTD